MAGAADSGEVVVFVEAGWFIRDPAVSGWFPLSDIGSPSDPTAIVAVSNGLLIWGPAPSLLRLPERSWEPLPVPPPGLGERWVVPAWTGDAIAVWGGTYQNQPTGVGAIWDQGGSGWEVIEEVGAPAARSGHALAWSGAELLVFGGGVWDLDAGGAQPIQEFEGGSRYNPETREWRELPTINGPISPYWGGASSLAVPRRIGGFWFVGGGEDPSSTWARMSLIEAGTLSWEPMAQPSNLRSIPAFGDTPLVVDDECHATIELYDSMDDVWVDVDADGGPENLRWAIGFGHSVLAFDTGDVMMWTMSLP